MFKNQLVIPKENSQEKQTHQSHTQADALSQPLASLFTQHLANDDNVKSPIIDETHLNKPFLKNNTHNNHSNKSHANNNILTANHTATGLAKIGRRIPPVEKWQPTHLGAMDLTITANGEWWHEGTRMTRQTLIDLFASILWRETDASTGKDHYFLKSPVEKIAICVVDVPLMVTDVVQFYEAGQDWLQFTTSTGDVVNADADHAIVMRPFPNTENGKNTIHMRPYIRVRQNLEAFIHRNVFYHLVEMGKLVTTGTETDTDTQLVLHSGGATFRLAAN